MENEKNLPIAKIAEGKLTNPEILDWKDVDGQKEGRGLVWVEKDNPITVLYTNEGEPGPMWGELRLGIVRIPGEIERYGPMIIEPPQEGDVRFTTSDQPPTRGKCQVANSED